MFRFPVHFLVSLLMITAVTPALFAQDPVVTEKVLLPLHLRQPVEGAFGSLFATRFSILNESGRPVLITGYDPLCMTLCPPSDPVLTPAGITFVNPPLANWVNPSDGVHGYFLGVDSEVASQVRFNLRVQDLSRQSETWGTEIPVVRESEALTGSSSLINVAVGPGFRQTLRIYDFDSALDASVMVRFYAVESTNRTPIRDQHSVMPDRLLLELPVALRTADSGQGRTAHPGYADLLDFGSRPELAGLDAVTIEITPFGEMRYWAFASVTNNETQHITVVTPQ